MLNAGKDVDGRTGEDLAVGSQEETATPGTFHSNPNWFSDMRSAFHVSLSIFTIKRYSVLSLQEFVVERCSKRTKDAVAGNEDIENPVDRRKVMNEIINQTVDYMAPIFGSDAPSMPLKKLILGIMIKFLFRKEAFFTSCYFTGRSLSSTVPL